MTASNTETNRPTQADGRVHGVIAAIRREDGKFLCIRRSRHVRAPRKVCFPGGTIEVGESQRCALVREIKEELGIDIQPIRQCWSWESPDAPLTLWGWIAEWTGGELKPDPTEIEEILWLSGDEVGRHAEGMATNEKFVKCLNESGPA